MIKRGALGRVRPLTSTSREVELGNGDVGTMPALGWRSCGDGFAAWSLARERKEREEQAENAENAGGEEKRNGSDGVGTVWSLHETRTTFACAAAYI
jgi:hypothetical protein